MSLTNAINADIKKAMLAREKDKLEALRSIKSALLLEATKEGAGGEISAEAEAAIVQKLYKQRMDALAIYKEQKREDLAAVEQQQAEVIKIYLPAQMSEDEVIQTVQETISSLGASGPSDMGKVMGAVMGKLKGKANGGLISSTVKAELGKI
ncbi:MAG: GatB/YqeY domain-containing protein [Flavobacteriales bacterium]|nr:GatB/YqeY domain-containing protein [Flavobacteriales bacterium]